MSLVPWGAIDAGVLLDKTDEQTTDDGPGNAAEATQNQGRERFERDQPERGIDQRDGVPAERLPTQLHLPAPRPKS